jgi:hypothetical protein
MSRAQDSAAQTQQFDDELLAAFMHAFYGYGSYQGDYWFVGMEEGGGMSFDEIESRLRIWDELGRRELMDMADFHRRLGMPSFFTAPAKLKPTWKRLVRIVLTAAGRKATLNAVRAYQAQRLGRAEGNTCLLELLPLPSPSTRDWLYARYSALRALRAWAVYRQSTGPGRIANLRRRIEAYRPKAVVFYGMGYAAYWKEIANIAFRRYEPTGFFGRARRRDDVCDRAASGGSGGAEWLFS